MKTLSFVFVLMATALFGGLQTDYLFFLVDAGETYALLPVIEKMQAYDKDYVVLVEGTARQIIKESQIPPTKVISFEEFGIEVPHTFPREHQLKTKEVEKISSRIQALLMVSGVASEMQGQLIDAYSKKNVLTVAYWDNFNATGEDSYFKMGHKVARKASTLFLPSKRVAQDKSFNPIPESKRMVVGQPSIESWRLVKTYKKDNLYKVLKSNKEQKHLTYVGGYGTAYEEGFKLFLKSVGDRAYSSYRLMISPHPKTDGRFEKQLVKASQSLLPETTVLSGELTTKEAVAISDVVICHRSSVGLQAASIGKPVIYVVPQTEDFKDMLVDTGVAKCVHTPESFKQAINQVLTKPQPNFYEKTGLPKGSTDTLFHALLYFIN